MTKRFIEEQMEFGIDLLEVSPDEEMGLEEYLAEQELSNCCGSKMVGADEGIPTDFCSGCMENSVRIKDDETYPF
jgi:hypothetical protein